MAQTTVSKIILRKGTESQRTGVVFNDGEPAWEQNNKQLYIGDGSTSGGWKIGGQGGTMGYTQLSADSIIPYDTASNEITLSGARLYLNSPFVSGQTIYASPSRPLYTGENGKVGSALFTNFEGRNVVIDAVPMYQTTGGGSTGTSGYLLQTVCRNASASNTAYDGTGVFHTSHWGVSSDNITDMPKFTFGIRADGQIRTGYYPIWNSSTGEITDGAGMNFYSARPDQYMYYAGLISCNDMYYGNATMWLNQGYNRQNTYTDRMTNGTGILQINHYRESTEGEGLREFWVASNSGDNLAYYGGTHVAGLKFKFLSGGDAYCDDAWNGGGADYAEMFEWSDGNSSGEDRVGKTVVLDSDGKINLSTSTDLAQHVIGIVSAKSAIVGNNPINWPGIYKTDSFGRPLKKSVSLVKVEIQEAVDGIDGIEYKPRIVDCDPSDIPKDGKKIGRKFTAMIPDVNTIYNPDLEYIPRKDRAEWSSIGLLGKLPVYKDQVKGDRWIKIRDITDSIEEWLIR